MARKILGLVAWPQEYKTQIEAAAQDGGADMVFLPDGIEGDERNEFILNQIADAEMVLGGMMSEAQFLAARQLKWIHVPWAGVERVLHNRPLVESEVVVTNAAGVMAGPLADQVLGYIINHSRKLLAQWDAQKQHEWMRMWDKGQPKELAGQTVGIIGYGRIGMEIAKRARVFGMRVIASKRRQGGKYPELDEVFQSGELGQLLEQSDYVVVSAPLTEETRGMIGKKELACMKPGGYFINIARGALVKENELLEALQEGLIAGAALDVFEVEPLSAESPLWDLPNVVITPHSSGNFTGFIRRTTEFYITNLSRYLNGEPLLNIVDKHSGY
jgi:phosphoglycerate dehydrogenase-like enzyme